MTSCNAFFCDLAWLEKFQSLVHPFLWMVLQCHYHYLQQSKSISSTDLARSPLARSFSYTRDISSNISIFLLMNLSWLGYAFEILVVKRRKRGEKTLKLETMVICLWVQLRFYWGWRRGVEEGWEYTYQEKWKNIWESVFSISFFNQTKEIEKIFSRIHPMSTTQFQGQNHQSDTSWTLRRRISPHPKLWQLKK